MTADDSLHADAAVCDFVSQLLGDMTAGAVQPLAAYQARFPAFAARIAVEYERLTATVAAPARAPAPSTDVGPYRLLHRLGHGGQGVVYRAEHRALGHCVALKMLREELLGLDAVQRARLRREAQALAKLDHVGVCGVYAAELDGPEPYLALHYVDGDAVSTLLEQARAGNSTAGLPPRDDEQVAQWLAFCERAALALDAVHRAELVHRDIKPSNLMRRTDGSPVLVDFGLARGADLSGAITSPRQQLGTLPYMAPEVLVGDSAGDARSDVYSLGVTVYELLTLQRPFGAASAEALLRQIQHGAPLPPSSLNPRLPRSLDLVLGRALEASPTQRYPDAASMAADLARVRNGARPAARRPALSRRVGRWLRRHPIGAGAIATLTVGLLLATLAWSVVAKKNVELVRTTGELQAVRDAYQALAMSETRPSEALGLVAAATRDHSSPELRDILMQVLDRYPVERWFLTAEPKAVPRLALSSCGTAAALSCGSGQTLVLDLEHGRALARVPTHAAGRAGAHVALLARGQLLVVGDQGGSLRTWQIEANGHTLQQELAPERGDGSTTAIAVSKDEQRIARCDRGGAVIVFDRATDAVVRCVGHTDAVSTAAFDATGKNLLTMSREWNVDIVGDNSVRLFDTITGQCRHSFQRAATAPRQACWGPDGTAIAIAWEDGLVEVRDSLDGAVRWHHTAAGQVHCVAFDPGSFRLWLGGSDGVEVRDLATGNRLFHDSGFRDRSAAGFAVAPCGLMMAAWSNGGLIHVYELATFTRRQSIPAMSRPIAVQWAAGLRLAALHPMSLALLRADGQPLLPTLRGHGDRITCLQLDATGDRLASGSRDGSVRTWAVASGGGTGVFALGEAVRTVRWNKAADRIVATTERGPARLLDAKQGTVHAVGAAEARDAWFFADDQQLITIASDGWLRAFDAASGELLQSQLLDPSGSECSAWHPHRPWLANGGGARQVAVFDVAAWAEVFRTPPWPWPHSANTGRRVHAVAWSRDGGGLFAGGQDQHLHAFGADGQPRWRCEHGPTLGHLAATTADGPVWAAGLFSAGVSRHAETGTEPMLPDGDRPDGVVSSLRMDPSGTRILCADKSGRVSVFDLATKRQTLRIRASSTPVLTAEFLPRGDAIVTGDLAGVIRIWPTDPLPIAERLLDQVVDVHDLVAPGEITRR